MQNQTLVIKTPEEAKITLINVKNSDKNVLDQEIDEICVNAGFKLTKNTSTKDYIYYICHLGGKPRKIVDTLREREKSSKKCGTIFIIFRINNVRLPI